MYIMRYCFCLRLLLTLHEKVCSPRLQLSSKFANLRPNQCYNKAPSIFKLMVPPFYYIFGYNVLAVPVTLSKPNPTPRLYSEA